MTNLLYLVCIALIIETPLSAKTASYPISDKEKRAMIRDILRNELRGKGMLKPGETLYLTQESVNPGWVRNLLSDRFVLLTPSKIKERELDKKFDWMALTKIEIKMGTVRISIEGPGRGITYEYRKKRGRWMLVTFEGYYNHT